MQQKHSQPLSVMYVAALADKTFLDEWETLLLPLQQAGHITTWSEQKLLAGASRIQQIDEHLAHADLILLLVSPDFFVCDMCMYSMQQAIERSKTKQVRLIPLLLKPSAWRNTPLSPFTPLPTNGNPITLWEKPDAARDEVLQGLRLALGLQREAVRSMTPSSTQSQQNRAWMLKKLRLWYKEMMDQSLQEAAWLELGLAQKPNAVQNAAMLLLRLSDLSERLLPLGTSITHMYDEAEHELLILGDPGAGKSTLLLKLAQELIMRAESNEGHPLPIILPLSSWAIKRPPLHTWMIEQIDQLYHISPSFTRPWIQQDQIIPLLDGLDEMAETARAACISAINAYHSEHLLPLVVCSRQAEYDVAAEHERLALHSAIVVQPLSREHIDNYLTQGGKPLMGLRYAFKKNRILREIATTPLMLSVLLLTYHGKAARDMPKMTSPAKKQQQQIFASYVKRMVERKGDVKHYPLEYTCSWLSWLARQMRENNQTVFSLEQIQPDWLSKRRKAIYRWSVGLLLGLGIVLFGEIVWMLVYWLPLWLFTGQARDPIGGLLGAIPIEVTEGLFCGLFFGLRTIQPFETSIWSWADIRSRLFVGLSFGMSGGGMLLLSRGLRTKISGKQLTERLSLSPNEGIRRSANSGVLTWLLLIPFVGIFPGLLAMFHAWPRFGLHTGLILGFLEMLFSGLILPLGLFFGLGAFIQHYILRFWLWRSHFFPWQAVSFLEDTTKRILLLRVGGGYSFTHRLLLDYFADLETETVAPSASIPPPQS